MVETIPIQADLTRLVYQDELTELYNRRYLYQYLNQEVRWKAHKSVASPTSLLMIDVDFFKEINDTYGHLEGDNVLKYLARLIRESIGPKDIPIRYAGDEFTVIMPGAQKTDAQKRAEALRQRVAQSSFVTKDKKEAKIQISLGLAAFPADADAPESLIDAADKALYYSKRHGKNQVAIAGTEDKAITSERDILNNFPPPVLVGREAIWNELQEIFTRVQSGNNAFILVEGEAGSGKTRLLKELNKNYTATAFCGYQIYLESGINSPYKLVSGLLSRMLEAEPALKEEVCQSITPAQHQESKKLITSLPSLSSPPTGEINDEERRKLLFEGLVAIITKLSEYKPIVILLDEFQNIDNGTLEIINCLNESGQGRLMTLGVVRTSVLDEVESKYPSLDNFLNEVSGTEWFRHIPLSFFDRATTGKFISALMPNRLEDAYFDEQVFNLTKGNPLFIEELIKNFILKKYIVLKGEQWEFQNIPASKWEQKLESVIHDNFMLLDKNTAELINQAAVVGMQIDFGLLKNLAGKNEGEILDLLDKAKSSRLMEESTPLQLDQYTFINQKVKEVSYEHLDNTVKQDLHRQMGQVIEKMYKDNLDAVSGELAMHFQMGADKERADQYAKRTRQQALQIFRPDEVARYYERGKMIIRSRIKEAIEPLPEDLMKLMKDIIRGLCGTTKNMRLYPEGSTLISNTTINLIKSLQNILGQTEKITFSEVKNNLHINTTSVDSRSVGPSVNELLTMMRDHYIKSFTIQRGLAAKEIETFLKDLDNSPNKNYSTAGYWNKFLEDKQITNVGVAQRAFVVTSTGVGSKISALAKQSQIDFTPETVPLIRDTIRYFGAALENIKLYPSGSQLTTQALQQLHQVLTRLFSILPVAEFSEVEDNLLLNGNVLNPRIFGLGTQTLSRIIKNNNIKSIGLTASYTTDELEKVLYIINSPPLGDQTKPADWGDAVMSKGIVNITLGQSVYSIADHKKGVWRRTSATGAECAGIGGHERDEHRPETKEELTLVNQSEKLLKSMPDKLVSADFIEVVNKLAGSHILKQLINLVDRFIDNFRSNRPAMRARALSFYANSFEKLSDPVKEHLVGHAAQILLQSIKSESSRENHPALMEAVYQTVNFHLKRKEYDQAASLVSALGRESENLSFLNDDQKQARHKTIDKIIGTEWFTSALQDIQSPDQMVQSGAMIFLSTLGKGVLPYLLTQIKTSGEPSYRELIANLLHKSGDQAMAGYVNELNSTTEIESLQRLLSVINIIAPPETNAILSKLLKHPDKNIYEEVLSVTMKLPKENAIPVLISGLEESETVALSSARSLAELGYREAGGQIVELFERVGDKKEVCSIMGKLGDPRTVSFLAGVLSKKSFLGLLGGYSDEVRGEAARALGHIKTPEAIAVLKKALKDKSPQVSAAAKLGLRDAGKVR